MMVHAGAEDDRGDLVRDFRALVHSVVVTPSPRGKEPLAEVRGKLAALIGGDVFPKKVGGTLVAEARYSRSPRSEEILFPIEVVAA